MRKAILLSAAGLALTASIASAGGIRLAWNDCLGAGGASNRSFACDTNVGSNDLYVSFDPAVDLPDVSGADAVIDLQSASYPLAAWWQFKNPGSCRLTALTAQTIPGGCAELWGGQATAGIVAYLVWPVVPTIPLNRARIFGSVSVPSASAVAVHPGTEYTVLVFRISNAKTVGLGACGGCQEQVCLVVSEVLLGTNNSGNWPINCEQGPSHPCNCPGAPGTFVTWQGSDTPTLNRTWGQVKSLYR